MSVFSLEQWSSLQKEAILAENQNILVSAGAGSGKTSVLVERVMACLFRETPLDLNQLLIVTFTEAAAAEMKERIGQRLEALYHAARKANETQFIRFLHRQLGLLQQAQISTLHSFCLDVVERNFLFLGLEPKFKLFTNEESIVLRKQLLRTLLMEWLEGAKKEEFRQMLLQFRAEDPLQLIDLVLRIDDFAQSQPHPQEWLKQIAHAFPNEENVNWHQLLWGPAFQAWILRRLTDAKLLFQQAQFLAQHIEELEKYTIHLTNVRHILEQAIVALNEQPSLAILSAHITALLSVKTPRAGDHPMKEIVKSLRNQGIEQIKQVEQVVRRSEVEIIRDLTIMAPHIEMFTRLVISFQNRFMAVKREQGRLDFQDLEHLAYQALENVDTGEQDRLRTRFAEIFIDEYQDTSPIQDAIIRSFMRETGNLFVVGDVKQSIYGFRMAEPKLFLAAYESLGHTVPGQVIRLIDNYRSRAGIVAFVNFVFRQLFTVETSGFAYDHRVAMQSAAMYPALPSIEPSIEVHLINRDGAWMTDDVNTLTGERDNVESDVDELSAIQKEAQVVATRIRELIGIEQGQEPMQVWDAKAGSYRPLAYRDIVVLMRSVKQKMDAFLTVLQAQGIPAYGSTSTGFFDALEIKWLLAALVSLDNPRRELQFVTFLTSPFVGFSDLDMANIRTARRGNFFECLLYIIRSSRSSSESEQSHEHPQLWQETTLLAKLHEFWGRFSNWRRLAKTNSALQMLQILLKDTDFLYYISGMPGGNHRKSNVQAFIERARAYDAQSSNGIFGFIHQELEGIYHEIDLGEAPVLGEADNVVRVMTIHHSKGLEFPVVIVADLGKQFYRDSQESNFMVHRDLGFGPTFYDAKNLRRWRTMASIAIEEQQWREFLAEEARILYVAMTRAKERLILIGSSRGLENLSEKVLLFSSHEENGIVPSAFFGAKSYLEWLMMTLSRHPMGRKTLARLSSQAPLYHGSMPDETTELCIEIWNHPQGRALSVEMRRPNPEMDFFSSMGRSELYTWITKVQQIILESGTLIAPIVMVDGEMPLTTIPGKITATELRRLWASQYGYEKKQKTLYKQSAEHLLSEPDLVTQKLEVSTGMSRGTAFHLAMQYLDLRMPPVQTEIERALDELKKSGYLSEMDRLHVNIEDVMMWFSSPLGTRVRKAKRILREQPFFSRIDVAITNDHSDFVVTQGVMDCLAEEEGQWLLIDFKTDQIDASMVEQSAKEYAAQIAAYLAACRTMTGEKPIHAYLYFVKPAIAVRMTDMSLATLFQK